MYCQYGFFFIQEFLHAYTVIYNSPRLDLLFSVVSAFLVNDNFYCQEWGMKLNLEIVKHIFQWLKLFWVKLLRGFVSQILTASDKSARNYNLKVKFFLEHNKSFR